MKKFEEHKKKRRLKLLGHKTSKETSKKIGEANKISLKGIKYPNRKKPIPFTEEHRKNIGDAHSGNKNYFWKDGSWCYEKKLWCNNQRRIKKIGNGGSHTLGEWQ